MTFLGISVQQKQLVSSLQKVVRRLLDFCQDQGHSMHAEKLGKVFNWMFQMYWEERSHRAFEQMCFVGLPVLIMELILSKANLWLHTSTTGFLTAPGSPWLSAPFISPTWWLEKPRKKRAPPGWDRLRTQPLSRGSSNTCQERTILMIFFSIGRKYEAHKGLLYQRRGMIHVICSQTIHLLSAQTQQADPAYKTEGEKVAHNQRDLVGSE